MYRKGRPLLSVSFDLLFTQSSSLTLYSAIMSVNKLTSIWGEDANEFRPERHLPPPDTAHAIPGVWGNLLTFLGGQRNCIGYRFALAEMKAILFVLIRGFKFEELASKPEIEKKSSSVTIILPI